jgi:homocysteine S-methyltransferase
MMTTRSKFCAALDRDGPLLLDGGLATQLEAQGSDISGALWSAALLKTDPEAIMRATRAYLDAGADIVASASYQASRRGFASIGLSAGEADDLMRLSVDLTRKARDEYLADDPGRDFEPLVAASIGPYGAILHDGSEYRGDYAISTGELHDFHAERLTVFDDSGADVLALETIPSDTEARVLAELLSRCRTPAWVSFSCRDEGHISDGTPIEVAAAYFQRHTTVLAVGINCTPPQFVPDLLRRVHSVLPELVLMAYPNSGETYNAAEETWTGTVTPLDCAAAAEEWIAAGAKLVGGCCRMGPAHIRAMAERIR